jgi:hypothetical protein
MSQEERRLTDLGHLPRDPAPPPRMTGGRGSLLCDTFVMPSATVSSTVARPRRISAEAG